MKDETGEKARVALETADSYLWLLRYHVDVTIRDYLIGTRLAPYIANESAGFRPPETGRIPDWMSEHDDDRFSAEEKGRIVRWRRQVMEWPVADACALVVQVLSDSLGEAERRVAEYRRAPLAPTREEQMARVEYVQSAFSWFSRIWDDLYYLLFRERLSYYIYHDPETVARFREMEAQYPS